MFSHQLIGHNHLAVIALASGTLLSLLAWPQAHATEPEGKVLVSGPLSVQLTYDKDAIESQKPSAPSSNGEVECSGGGLLGAMNCVTLKIENAGTTSSATREKGTAEEGTEGRPAIHVIMSGRVIPTVTDQGNGQFLIQIKDVISMPQFSTGTPGDIKSSAARDEATLKLGLRRWSKQLTVSELQAQPEQEVDFSSPFDQLSLFTVRAPNPQSFKVFWRSSQCDQLEEDFRQAQTDYIAHVSSMPVLDQIELVTRTMDEIEDALSLTAKGSTAVADNIAEITELTTVNEKFDELMEETDGLSSALTGALDDIRTRLGEEHERLMKSTGLGDPLSKVQKGLEQNAKTMKKVATAIADMNSNIKKLGELFEVADGNASTQLRAFKDYFGAVQEKLGPLIKAIPGLGVFLDLYGQAIGQIADSAERIEKVVNERNLQARKAGIPEPYVKTKTARERAAAEKKRLENKMNDLAGRIARECPSFDLSGEEYGEIQAIEDAKYRAHDACQDKRMSLSDEARIRRDFRDASRGYSARNVSDAEDNYANMLDAYKELQNMNRKVARNSVRSREERARVAKYFKLYYQDKKRISEYEDNEVRYFSGRYTKDDMTVLDDYLKGLKQRLRQTQKERNQKREKKARYDKAKVANDALNSNNQDYHNCVKKFVQGLARENGWDPRLVEVLNSGSL